MADKTIIDNPKIYQNAVRKDGVFYQSRFRHDFVEFAGGFIDGGKDYIRRGGYGYEDFSVYENDSLEVMVDKLLWGTRGINGDQPLKWILLKDAETDHLKSILANVPNIGPKHLEVINFILNQRDKQARKQAKKPVVSKAKKPVVSKAEQTLSKIIEMTKNYDRPEVRSGHGCSPEDIFILEIRQLAQQGLRKDK